MVNSLVAFTLRRVRYVGLGLLISLVLVACGSVGVGGNSALSTGPSGVPSSGGGSPPPSTASISGAPATTAIVGQTYSFTPSASDSSSSATLTFSIANKPDWASFDGTTGTLTGTPTAASVGTFGNIQISVSDGQSSADLDPFAITVAAPLTISGTPPVTATVNAPYSFQPTTNASPGTALVFSAQNAPAWLALDSGTGEISGTPTQTGAFANIIISVSDGIQTSSLPAFTITVSSPVSNSPPTISGQPAASVTAGSAYSFTPKASDPNGLALTFSAQNVPAWASFSSATGTLSGTPTASQVGTYSGILISVSDGTLSASLPTFSIKVVAPLTISGTPATQVTAGKGYSFQPTTNAPTGAALTFSIQNRPAWATFSASTGMLSGTPSASQTGTYSNIVISVSNGTQTVSLAPFAIQVIAPLTISGVPPTQATVGKSYAFQPTTNAPSGSTLVFAIQNKPSWAAFNTASGALTGTPTTAQVGTYANIGISVSSNGQTASLGAFSITVAAALTISGSPPGSVNAGSPYSFTPTVTGAGSGTLSFTVQNLPSWAAFNTSNGTVSGTPGAASVGTYANIGITVNNGTASASLPPFTITVNQVSNGTASLDWTAVTQNTDGSVIAGLAGYKIYYGTSATALNTVVTISNPSVTSYVLSNLSSGVWYFEVAAYTSSGTVGLMSNVGQKTVP